MGVKASVSKDGSEVTLRVDGRFDFKLHREFREAYKAVDPRTASVILDMKDAEYMDSSALGMMLLLREHMGGDKTRVRVSNCSEGIRRVLTIANFDRLFDLH